MKPVPIAVALALLAAPVLAQDPPPPEPVAPPIGSMSALTFGPDGILFVGDGPSGAIFALDLGERPAPIDEIEPPGIRDVETRIAALVGARAGEIMIHDLAVHPGSLETYLSISRGRGRWDSGWLLPNDLSEASILVRIDPSGELEEVDLAGVPFTRADLPNPVAPDKTHRWKAGISLRADTITDLVWEEGTLWVAGLSNEEFASTLWRIPYPFAPDRTTTTTLEIFHGAHGEWETHAPIRTFLPYHLGGVPHLLAAYLCTPLVTFETETLVDGAHVKGRTVAEFGSGNYPLDMVAYEKEGVSRLLIANSNLPLMIVDPAEIAAFEGSITEEVEGYVAGVSYLPHSGTGIQQIDRFGDEFILALQRLPGGTMNLVAYPTSRL